MSEIRSRWFLWVSTAVLLLAALMRLVLLQGIPLGLARDEVRNAEIASFIRQGEHALFFRAGFGHEPLYHYFGVPFQVLLGDNVLSVRLPSVFLGLLLIAAVLRWVRRDFGQVTAVVAGLGLALGWMAIIFSRIGIRPIMEPLFLVGMAWFWQKRPSMAGLFLGLSLYTYTAARVLFLLPVLFAALQVVFWIWDRKQVDAPTLMTRIKPSLIILGTAVLIYLPLFFTLRADPTLQARVEELSGPLTALQAGDVRPVLQATLRTLGVFSVVGDPRWTYTIPDMPLFNWVTAVFFYAGLAVALWRIRLPQYALILVWLGVALIPSAVTPDSPSLIRIIGALPIIYLLPGLAITVVKDQFQSRAIRPVWAFSVLLVYLVFLLVHTWPQLAIWPEDAETRHKYQTIFQEMGAHWQANGGGLMVVADDFYEPIERQSLRMNMGHDAGSRWVQTGALVLPREGGGLLYVPEYAPLPLGLMRAAGVDDEVIYRNGKRPSFAVYQLPEAVIVPQQMEPILFGEEAMLLGFALGEPADGSLPVFTYWRVVGDLPTDLAIFVHLLDGAGNLVVQHDGLDAVPETLQAGDVVVQLHSLPLAGSLPQDYSLQTGLYVRSTGTRLVHPGELSDRVVLETSE